MRGLSGLTLVLAGGLAGVYGYFPEPSDRQAALDSVVSTAARSWSGDKPVATGTRADAPLVVADPQRRAFSPQAPLFQQVPQHAPAAAPSPLAAATASPVKTVAPAAPVDARPSQPETVVADLKVGSTPVPTTPLIVTPARPSVAKVDDEDAQRELARNLQKELKRVGCYDGELNGTWSPASKRAMKAFTDRVNATLPVEAPDYVLLTLVQGHGAEACGSTCPADQAMAKNGRCMPRAIVAQAEKPPVKKAVPQKLATAKTPERPAVQPKSEQVAAKSANSRPDVDRAVEMWSKVSGKPADKPVGSGWQTATVVAPPAPAVKPVAQPAAVVITPLPGRMAVGAPVPAPMPALSRDAAHDQATTAGGGSVAAVPDPTQSSEAAGNGKNGSNPRADKADKRRIPSSAVASDRPRPQRVKPTYGSGAVYAPKPAGSSKQARVRTMHYNMFNRPDRVTN